MSDSINDILNNNEIPIYEPGLEEIVSKNFYSNRLKFTTNLKLAVNNSDIVFICVGTPTSKKNGAADLRFVFNASNEIAVDSFLNNSIQFKDIFIIVEKVMFSANEGDPKSIEEVFEYDRFARNLAESEIDKLGKK